MREVVKKEVLKLLHAGIICLMPHSEWVSPVQVVPKKGGMTVVENNKNEPIPQQNVTGSRMCIDYRKLNSGTKKDHFPLPFIDEMLERLVKHSFFCSLMGIQVIIKFPYTPMIRARPHSRARTEPMLIVECLLGFATLLHLFSGA
jgi:hypothetical protein